MNGLRCRNSFALPFLGLWQDINWWIIKPSTRPEAAALLDPLVVHSWLVIPVIVAIVF